MIYTGEKDIKVFDFEGRKKAGLRNLKENGEKKENNIKENMNWKTIIFEGSIKTLPPTLFYEFEVFRVF